MQTIGFQPKTMDIFVLMIFGFSRLPAPFCYQFKYSCHYAAFHEHAWLLVREIIARRLFTYKDFMFLFPVLSRVSIMYLLCSFELWRYSLLAGLQRYMLNNTVSSLTSALLYPKAERLKGGEIIQMWLPTSRWGIKTSAFQVYFEYL